MKLQFRNSWYTWHPGLDAWMEGQPLGRLAGMQAAKGMSELPYTNNVYTYQIAVDLTWIWSMEHARNECVLLCARPPLAYNISSSDYYALIQNALFGKSLKPQSEPVLLQHRCAVSTHLGALFLQVMAEIAHLLSGNSTVKTFTFGFKTLC